MNCLGHVLHGEPTFEIRSLLCTIHNYSLSVIPLQLFTDFTKVSRSPIIRSIRLLYSARHGRHLYIISWAHCGLRCFLLLPPPPQIRSERNYVTSKTETENRFWPFPKPKNRFYRRNPVLETLLFNWFFWQCSWDQHLRWPMHLQQVTTTLIIITSHYEFR